MKNYRAIWTKVFGPIIKGFQVHHIKPRSEGGGDNLGNLIALHPDDHALIHEMRGDKWTGLILAMRDGPSLITRQKLSKAKQGKNNNMYGKTHSKNTKIKMSKATSGVNSASYDPTVHKFYHKDHGLTLCTRYSLKEKFNLHSSHISQVILGKRKSHKGWTLTK